jgi:hypothetical protein
MGVILSITVVSMMTLLVSVTTTLLIWGGGIIIFNDLYANDIIPLVILRSAVSCWTLMSIVIFILLTIWIWMVLMKSVADKYAITDAENIAKKYNEVNNK